MVVLPMSTRCIFFSGAHLVRTPKLSALDPEQFQDGDLLESFSGCVRVRTKNAGKTRVGLWR